MKKLSILCLTVLMALCAFAEKGAVMLHSPLTVQIMSVSPNGKWACGVMGDGYTTISQGVLWDLESGEIIYLSGVDESYAFDVTNDGMVVGSYTDYTLTGNGAGTLVAGYYKDGVWAPFDNTTIEGVSKIGGEVYAVSADGRVAVGYVMNGPSDTNLAPAKWVDGKLELIYDYYRAGVAYSVSDDGTYATGWAYKQYVDNKGEIGYNRSIALWTDESAEFISEHPTAFEAGRKISGDNTKLLCDAFGDRYIYNIQTKEKTILPKVAGPATWSQNMYYINNDGLVLGGETLQDESTGRSETYGYVFDGTKAYKMHEWLKEAYNVEISTKEYIISAGVDMSADGKVIALNDYPCQNGIPVGDWASTIILLDREVDYCEPVALKAVKQTALNSVRLTWNEPLMNAGEVLGYNVYRDGVQVATELSDRAYVDNLDAEGTYTYTVTALYGGEGDELIESIHSTAAVVEVYPEPLHKAQNIEYHAINYNDLKLRWAEPESNLPSTTYFDKNATFTGFGGGLNSFTVAIRLPYDVVANFAGHYALSRVSFMPLHTDAGYSIKVYVDGAEVVNQPVNSALLNFGVMNTIDLNAPVQLSENQAVLVAVDIDASKFTAASNAVIGASYGNCINGYSDLLHNASEPEFYSLNQKAIEIGMGEMPMSWAITAVFASLDENGKANVGADIIAGYDVYRDNNKLASVTEANYIDTNISDGTHTYGIVVQYANGEAAEAETVVVDFTAKTEALQPIDNVTIKAEPSFVKTSWNTPLNNDATFITYAVKPSSGRGITMSGATDLIEYTVAADFPYSFVEWYEGYNIESIRFYPTAEATFAVALEVDGIDHDFIVLNGMGEEGGYTLNTWNTVKLTTPLKIAPGASYRVKVYCTDVDPTTNPVCLDSGVGITGVSDLYSWDYSSFSSAMVDGSVQGNWMLGMVVVNDNTDLLPVEGYNVLLDGKKANTELVKENTFTQEGIEWKEGSTHRVKVNAVYAVNGGTLEVEGRQQIFTVSPSAVEGIEVDRVKVYPNPATSFIAVEGNAEKLVLIDMAGRTVAETTADVLDVTSLPVGNYLLNVHNNGEVNTVKVVIVR